jgi:hypothetical protein
MLMVAARNARLVFSGTAVIGAKKEKARTSSGPSAFVSAETQ